MQHILGNPRNISSATHATYPRQPATHNNSPRRGNEIVYAALSYQQNKIAPLDFWSKDKIARLNVPPPLATHYDIFGGELYFFPQKGLS